MADDLIGGKWKFDEAVARLSAAFDGDWAKIPDGAMIIAMPENWTPHNIAEFKSFWDVLTGREDVFFMPHDAYDVSEIRNGIVSVVDNAVEIIANLASDQPNRLLARRQLKGLRERIVSLRLKVGTGESNG